MGKYTLVYVHVSSTVGNTNALHVFSTRKQKITRSISPMACLPSASEASVPWRAYLVHALGYFVKYQHSTSKWFAIVFYCLACFSFLPPLLTAFEFSWHSCQLRPCTLFPCVYYTMFVPHLCGEQFGHGDRTTSTCKHSWKQSSKM